MKVFMLVVAVLALSASASALTPDEKQTLFANNMHNTEILDPKPKQCMVDFLKDLELHETFIKLDMPIKGGHSVMYAFQEGKSTDIVKELAEKHELSVVPSRAPCAAKCDNCCGRIVLPGGDVVEANTVPMNREERQGMPKEGLPGDESGAAAEASEEAETEASKEEEVEKGEKQTTAEGPSHGPYTQELEDKNITKNAPLTADQKQWYFDNNYAQVTKMDGKAQAYLKKFLNDMKENAPNTVLHFMSPVRNGHTIRFTVVEGDDSSISQYATTCGMTLDGDTLVAPGGEVVEAEDNMEAADGHPVAGHVEENSAGEVKPIKVGPLKRGPLKDQWIHPALAPALVEETASDDSDALILVPNTPAPADDDSDALVQDEE